MDVVRFKGGLGNQMFQYAFMKALSNRGRNVKGSLGFYRNHPDWRPFILKDVFKNISIDEIGDDEFNKIDNKWKGIKADPNMVEEFKHNIGERFFWVEDVSEEGKYISEVFETKECVFVGYWQTYKYFSDIRTKLLDDFTFSYGEDRLDFFRKQLLQSRNSVSIHIRRGDYLRHPEIYGNICTEYYYRNAIEYVKNKYGDVLLVFFSDDLDWVKEHLHYDEALYIGKNCFDKYEDWYDMCLMSCCSINIIANSSFSWWAAWLNKNTDSEIIIPEGNWNNEREMPDICPKCWTKISTRL